MKRLIIAVMFAAMAAFATEARANNIGFPVPFDVAGSGGTYTFSAVHTDNSDFTDTFNFLGLPGSYLVDALLTNIAFTTPTNINFTSVTLNGVFLSLQNDFIISAAFTSAQLNFSGPLTLVVNGSTGATAGINSSYAGTLNVTAVPEPASLMLLGAGLAGIGIWRRKAAKIG